MGKSRSLVEIIYSNIISFQSRGFNDGGYDGYGDGESLANFFAYKVKLLCRMNIVPCFRNVNPVHSGTCLVAQKNLLFG